MKVIMNENMRIIRRDLPGADLLPTIGNNDVFLHNKVPCDELDSSMYYS